MHTTYCLFVHLVRINQSLLSTPIPSKLCFHLQPLNLWPACFTIILEEVL